MKKVLAFDLDDTLAITKSPISDRMAKILEKILEKYHVCVITGGKIEQINLQVVDRLNISDELKSHLHLMPTCGTRYFRYNPDKKEFEVVYANILSEEQKAKIREALETSAKEVGLWEENPYGEIIEDRLSQITYSALGQQAPAELKYKWSDDHAEDKLVLRDKIAEKLPELEVRLGGTTSVDVTYPGIDKAYGMQKLMEHNGFTKDEILFFGDKMMPGGNDYPVKQFGIDSIEVNGWETTAYALEGILGVTE